MIRTRNLNYGKAEKRRHPVGGILGKALSGRVRGNVRLEGLYNWGGIVARRGITGRQAHGQ